MSQNINHITRLKAKLAKIDNYFAVNKQKQILAISLLERLMQNKQNKTQSTNMNFNQVIDFLNKNSPHKLTEQEINKAINSSLVNRILIENIFTVNKIVRENIIDSNRKIKSNIDLQQLITKVKSQLFIIFQKNFRGFLIEVVKLLPIRGNNLLQVVNTIQNCNAKEIFEKYSKENTIFFRKIRGQINYLIQQIKHNSTGSTAESAIKHPSELVELDEPKQTEWETASSFDVDKGIRDFPFAWINGELLYGDNAESIHQDLINKYIASHGIDSQGAGSPSRIRSMDDIPQLDPSTQCAFGHCYKNCAFIEIVINNPPVNTIIQELAKKFSKVYDYNHSENKLKRLAKRKK